MIKFLYGSHYTLYPFFVTPDDIGHTAVSRARVYIIMVHRERVEMVIDPYPLYEKIKETIAHHIHTRPRDYLIASENEISMDAADVARVRKKRMTVPGQLINECEKHHFLSLSKLSLHAKHCFSSARYS